MGWSTARGCLAALFACLGAAGARAQAADPAFPSLPAFAWPTIDPLTGRSKGEASYARMSTGFEVSSSRRFGTSAGPTVGFEGGKVWRDGDVLVGVSGGFDYMAPFGSAATPAFGRLGYTRDLAAGLDVKAGTFVTDDVLVYARAGIAGVNGTLHVGPSRAGPGFSRDDIAVWSSARVGVEWAVTDRLTVGVEVGTARRVSP